MAVSDTDATSTETARVITIPGAFYIF